MVSKIKEKSIANNAITTAKLSSDLSAVTGIKVSSIAYLNDDTAANTIGGDIITVNGAGFTPNTVVYIDRTQAGVVTYLSNTQITFSSPAKTAGSYILYLYNADGGSAAYIPGINYSGVPAWSTASGSIGTTYEFTSFTGNVTTLSATSDTTVYYLLNSGTLPTGAVLNANTGVITGNTGVVNSQTTYNFVIEAKDQENQGTLRNFSITINPDAVTWNSPANETLYNITVGGSVTQALSASSAAGKSITYSANTLPGGLSISGSNITGTPNTVANTTSLITATSATTNRTATRTLLWYAKSVAGAPTIGTATATGTTTATVTFTAPASNGNSPITSYTAVSSPGGVTGTLTQSGSGTISISGLTAGTTYTFTVYATNAAGNSSSSASSNSITLTSVPDAPTIGTATATGQTTATVSFSAPAFNGGATITSYTATSSPGGITGTLSQSGSGTITVSGLTASTSYTFTVKATNAVGQSVASSSSNQITTAAAIPGAPTIGVARGSGQTTATVSFTAPASSGGSAITSYTAVSSPGGITGSVSQSGSGTITVSGLSVGTSYTFTVYATNGAGNSPNSSASNSTTTFPNLGASFGGGYFAGAYSSTGNGVATHLLIIAPRSPGQNATEQRPPNAINYRTSNSSAAGTTSRYDGYANQQAMIAIDSSLNSFPAAQFCRNLTIGGFTDWYLPSIMEMEIVYFNLKPTSVGDRSPGPDNEAQGNNAYSIPSRASQVWNGSSPSQTSVGIFQDGQSEALTTFGGINNNAMFYWTSTSSGGEAYTLSAKNGYGGGWWGYELNNMNYGSTGDGRQNIGCRAIRKVAL
jgi:hypothetical protein